MAILNLIRNTTWERRCWQWNKAAVVNTMACQAQLVQGLHSPSPHYDDALGQIPTVPSNHRFTGVLPMDFVTNDIIVLEYSI